MRIDYTDRFKRKYKKLPQNIKDDFREQLQRFIANNVPPYHPSLRIKKIQGTENVFELTVNMAIRMTFEFIEEGILIRNIGFHDITLKKP